jgi:hypothetical protein
MTMSDTVSEAGSERLSPKLQAFYDGLPEDEQDVLADVLQHAAADGGRGAAVEVNVQVSGDLPNNPPTSENLALYSRSNG